MYLLVWKIRKDLRVTMAQKMMWRYQQQHKALKTLRSCTTARTFSWSLLNSAVSLVMARVEKYLFCTISH